MENPQGLNHEASKPPVRPIVEYDPQLLGKDVPYSINVDGEKCTELFREFGISDEKIKKLKIKVKKKPFLRKVPEGKYNFMNGDVITIYADVLWQKYGQHLNQNREAKSYFGKGMDLVRKIGTISRSPEEVFLHESKHAFDFEGKTAKVLGAAYALTYLALPLYPVLYAVNPYEIRARKFARKHKNDLKWQNILTIAPKQR